MNEAKINVSIKGRVMKIHHFNGLMKPIMSVNDFYRYKSVFVHLTIQMYTDVLVCKLYSQIQFTNTADTLHYCAIRGVLYVNF